MEAIEAKLWLLFFGRFARLRDAVSTVRDEKHPKLSNLCRARQAQRQRVPWVTGFSKKACLFLTVRKKEKKLNSTEIQTDVANPSN